MNRFTNGTFKNEHEATIGVEFGGNTIKCEDKIVKIQVWDTVSRMICADEIGMK